MSLPFTILTTYGFVFVVFSTKLLKYGAIPKHDKYIDLVSPQDIVFARSESGNIC
jgi:hypothetical protein